MSGGETHYNDCSSPGTSFFSHDQSSSQTSAKIAATYRQTDYVKTTLPPFSTMMPGSLSSVSQPIKFPYDNDTTIMPSSQPVKFPYDKDSAMSTSQSIKFPYDKDSGMMSTSQSVKFPYGKDSGMMSTSQSVKFPYDKDSGMMSTSQSVKFPYDKDSGMMSTSQSVKFPYDKDSGMMSTSQSIKFPYDKDSAMSTSQSIKFPYDKDSAMSTSQSIKFPYDKDSSMMSSSQSVKFPYDKDSGMISTSQSVKFPYDKDFTEPKQPQNMSSHSQQTFDSPLDNISANSSEEHFYRSAVRSSELPNPLPIPPYSEELINARECGRTVDYRSMVIRETVKYFLKMKYWWTSEDYDGMARMVAKEFPDLRDPNVSAGQPDYIRIRAHLSQTARNLRRVAKNQQNRKLMSKSDVTIATTITHGSTETEQDTMPSPIVHSLKQEVCSNRTALPSVAHILSKQYLSPSPISYPMSTASLLPQMMSASSILASPAYQKFLHSSLLAMSPGGMSALSQKLLSQLAAGTYQTLPGFAHNSSFPCPVKVEQDSEVSEYGSLASYAASRIDSYSDDSDHPQEQDSPEVTTRDRGHVESHVLSDQFSSAQDLSQETVQDAENQRLISTPHHRRSSSTKRHSDSISKDLHPRGQPECEDGIKSPTSALSDEAELPNPLPIPKYSERVLTANEMGMTKDMRSTIIRETTTFFLNIKYRWTSSDYDRISSMVVSLFPALRDPIASPGYAPTRRVRSDLSMCARNIRRRDVNKITTGYARKKSRASFSHFNHDSGVGLNIKAEPVFSQYSELEHKYWDEHAQPHNTTRPTHDQPVHGQTQDSSEQTYNSHEQSHNFLGQTHDTHGQAYDSHGHTSNNPGHIQDAHGQNYHSHGQMYDHPPMTESTSGCTDLSSPSEAHDVSEACQKDTENRSASVDLSIREYSSNGEDLRKNSLMPDRSKELDCSNSSFKQDRSYVQSKGVSLFQALSRDAGHAHDDQSFENNCGMSAITVYTPNTDQMKGQRDTSVTMVLVPDTDHMTDLSNETVMKSCARSSSSSHCALSESNIDKSLEAHQSTVHSDLSYEHLKTFPSQNEPAECHALALVKSRISHSDNRSLDSSCRSALETTDLIPVSHDVLNARSVHDANGKHKTGNYSTEVDLNHENKSNRNTGDRDESVQRGDDCDNTMRGAGCDDQMRGDSCDNPVRSDASDYNQDDSYSAMMFTPLSVRDIKTSTNGGEVTEPGVSSHACKKAGDWVVNTDNVQPELQRKFKSSEIPSKTKPTLVKCAALSNVLPDPLPVPTYSLNVRKNQQLGRVLDVKQQVIRETVSFYLQTTSTQWSNTDYSRVVNMILLHFPEFRAVKMLKKMIFFTVRNLTNKKRFFHTGGYWKRKHRWLKQQQKHSTSNQHSNQNHPLKMDTVVSRGGNKAENDADMATRQADSSMSDTNILREFVCKPSDYSHTSGMAGFNTSKVFPKQHESTESDAFDQMKEMYEKVITHHTPQSAMTGIEEERTDNQNNYISQPSENVNRQADVNFTASKPESQQAQSAGEYENTLSHHGHLDLSNTSITLQDGGHRGKNVPDYLRTSLIVQESDQQDGDHHGKNVPDYLRTSVTVQESDEQDGDHQGKNVPDYLRTSLTVQESDQQDGDHQGKNVPDYLRTSLTRQISLPSPLPVPHYSQQLLDSPDYTMKHSRLQIIRETVKHFLLIKYWWSSRDYERIAEMVVSRFPRLADQDSQSGFLTYRKVRQELSMCARNLRRRFVWWDQQSNLKDKLPVDDVKYSVTRCKEDPEREATLVDSGADSTVRSDMSGPVDDSSAYSGHHGDNTAQSVGGYRSNVSRRLSPLDHHGHSAACTVVPSVLKMKKTYVNPDHGNKLQNQLSLLWKEGKYLDADLEVNGTKIQAHKLILLAMCPFLQSTLDQTDTKHRIEISMPENSSVEAVDAFLKYLYDGVIHINTNTVHALSKIADMMHMQKLYKYCQDFLQSWKREQQLQEEELNVCRLSLRGPDTESSQGSLYNYQPANIHSGQDRCTLPSIPVKSDTGQGLIYQAGTVLHPGQDRCTLPSMDDPSGSRQQYFQSNQSFDNMYDATYKQRIAQFQNSCNSGGMGSQRDVSLKVDRRISDRIADSYSRRSSGSSHSESHCEPIVKRENSGLSGKQEMDYSGVSEQSVFPQWWPSKT